MNTSLRDQLLAAGLVTEKQARQARQQEQQRQFRDRAKTESKGPPTAAQQAQAAKSSRDLELNRRQQDKAQRRARIAAIEQLIERDRVPRLENDDHYSFIDGKKIRRMCVDQQRREKLTRGELIIVRYKGHYAVVPPATAQAIRELDPNMIVPVVQPKGADQDDAYKDFVVPDDLMW